MARKQVLIILVVLIIVLIASLYIFQTEGFVENTFGPAQTSPGVPCSPGFWCPTASGGTKAFPCPGGTYGSASKLTQPNCSGMCNAGCVCKEASTDPCPAPCPPGYYCVAGTGGQTPPIICPQGYYCTGGTVTPTVCPPGIYCPLGTSSLPA
jgi:hypothetical protein